MSPWLTARNPLDRAVAAVVGMILFPLCGILATVIRRTSKGPAIVLLPRIGRHGRPFTLLKLRTMRAGDGTGRARGSDLTAGRDDARVTPLGRYLRTWRLDELPQLLHVLRGGMSLIGPRPETPAYVDVDDPRWRLVLEARPGIAGASQVVLHDWEERVLAAADSAGDAYRDLVLPLKLDIDEWYVRTASPLADLVVVAGLIERFVARRAVTCAHRWIGRRVPGVDEVTRHIGIRRDNDATIRWPDSR